MPILSPFCSVPNELSYFARASFQPILSNAPVIGSMEMMSALLPMFMTAPSIPAEGPRVTSSRLAPRFLKMTFRKMSTGIFLGSNVMAISSSEHSQLLSF
jgi:Na+/proline symporter